MAVVTILGSSSGIPSADRFSASLVVEIQGKLYQFDAGEGVCQAILRGRIDHSLIGNITITHAHADHISGLFMELQMMHLARRIEPLIVYMPSELKDAFEKFMAATYLFPETLGFDLQIRPVIPDPVFRDGNMAVYARANSHLEKYRDVIESGEHSNRMESYSFVIKAGDTRIIYTGDVGSLDDYVDLLDGCSALITEGAHIDLDALFAAAAANEVGNIILTHLTAETYAQPQALLDLASKYGISNLHIARDGLKLAL